MAKDNGKMYGTPLTEEEKEKIRAYYDRITEEMKTVRAAVMELIDGLFSVYTSTSSETVFSSLQSFINLYLEHFISFIEDRYDKFLCEKEVYNINSKNYINQPFYDEMKRIEHDALMELMIDYREIHIARDDEEQLCLTENSEIAKMLEAVIEGFSEKIYAILETHRPDAEASITLPEYLDRRIEEGDDGTDSFFTEILELFCDLIDVDEDLSLTFASWDFYNFIENEYDRKANPGDYNDPLD